MFSSKAAKAFEQHDTAGDFINLTEQRDSYINQNNAKNY